MRVRHVLKASVLPALALLSPVAGHAAPVWPAGDLTTARVYVTGTRVETRAEGIATALRRVLVKLSGNPALADDPRVAAFDPLAASMVDDIAYQDRLSDEAHHDEQGTRDRPYDLAVAFDRERVQAVLALLGDHAWNGRRPRIVIHIGIDDHGTTFPLAADGEAGERQREALLAAADRFGLRVVLTPIEGAPPVLPPSAVVLSGTVRWSDQATGWVGNFHLDAGQHSHDWSITEGGSFDEAYRQALGTAMAVLSGHIKPRRAPP